MTKNRARTQIILVFTGLFLILATYFLYPEISKKKTANISNEDGTTIIENEESSLFEKVEYEGFYGTNNPYTVKAKKAYVLDDDLNVIYMIEMHVTLYASDGRVIIITSDKGSYNKSTYDCFFKNNVHATDGETIILSKNLDLLSTDSSVIAYNDVVLTNEKGSLQADKVDYNFDTKYYKITMFDDTKVKVKLIR